MGPATGRAAAVAAALVLLAVAGPWIAHGYVPMARHSLLPPFEDFKEHSGARDIPYWDYGGAVLAKKNFLRLTPDKQSKRGYLFNKEPLDKKEFGVQMKFRISGGGKHLYGDGISVWLTQQGKNPKFKEGMILGHTDTFTGIGILFDTFRNVEHGHVHKDISLLIGTGEPISLDTERPGCEAHYRYFEGREDFDVENESVARIWLERGVLTLEVDPLGQDEFEPCFKVDLSDELPEDWQKGAHLGLSASTGALADNHDLLAFMVAEPKNFAHILRLEAESEEAPSVVIDVHSKIRSDEVAEHVNDLSFEVSDLDKSLQKLQHEFEHSIEKLKGGLEDMMGALKDEENTSQDRIAALEKQRADTLEKKMDARLGKLEDSFHDVLERRLSKLEEKLGLKITQVASESGGTPGGSWSWWLFFAVLVGVVAYMAYLAKSVRKLHSRDKLI